MAELQQQQILQNCKKYQNQQEHKELKKNNENINKNKNSNNKNTKHNNKNGRTATTTNITKLQEIRASKRT